MTLVKTSELNTYCAFCSSGNESRVKERLERMGYEGLIPQTVRSVVTGGKERLEHRKLFPGYVFFRAAALNGREVMAVQGIQGVIRLLRYEEGSYALTKEDLAFIIWIWLRGGTLDVSRAYREGDRIRVIDGPLKDYEGLIVQVNKKRKSVAIQLPGKSLLGKIWCSIELLSEAK